MNKFTKCWTWAAGIWSIIMLVGLAINGCVAQEPTPQIVAPEKPLVVVRTVTPDQPTIFISETIHPCWIKIGPKYVNMSHVTTLEIVHNNELYGVILKQISNHPVMMKSEEPEKLISNILYISKDCNRK